MVAFKISLWCRQRKLNHCPLYKSTAFVKNRPDKTVLIRIKDDIPKQKERLCVSEHPFGTVKWHHGAHYVLCKGIKKTTAELGLSFLAYNLRRAINMIGTKAILEGIEA